MLMNKPAYLGLSILGISKIVMYEFWYWEKAKSCYMNTDSFIVYSLVRRHLHRHWKDVEKKFDSSNYQVYRPLPGGKNNKSYQIIERSIRWKAIKVCSIETKNIWLYNRW